jgi:hypothetical protein
VTCEPLCRVPQDINPDSSTKSVPTSGESPKTNKPPTPNTEKTVLGSSKPPSLGGTQNSPGAGGAPSSFAQSAPSPSPTGASSSSKMAKSPKTSPPSPQSYGLGSVGGYPLGCDSSVPCPEKQPWQYSRIAESLANNPEFIKAGFHIDRFITTAVDTEADRANIKALYSNLESASTCLNVSIF